jgi:hypothetical protein
MTRISKRKIKDEEFEKIFKKFIEVMDLSGSKKYTRNFVNEFFYPTERIMFAKRIGIIYMIINKIPDRVIAETLSISTSTVGRMIEKYEKGDYKYLESVFKKDNSSLIDIIERIYFILPPKVGRKRYRFVRQGSFHI